MKTLEWIASKRKAIGGAIAPAVVVLLYSITPDSDGGGAVTVWEWVLLSVAGLTSGGIVYGLRNGRKPVQLTPPV